MSTGRNVRTGPGNQLTPFNAQEITVADGATDQTYELDLGTVNPAGFFSAQVTTASAGAAVLQLQYKASNDGVTYTIPEDKDGTAVDDIVTAHAVGTRIYSFGPIPAKFIKLVATVTVATADVTVKLCIQ